MNERVQVDAALKQLEFELDEGSGSRFFIAVCDSVGLADQVRKALDEHVRATDDNTVSISMPKNTGHLVNAVVQEAGSSKPRVVHILQAKAAPPGSADKLFGELNFQRDSLAKLQIPIIVWIYSRQLPRLAARAPDFWSRRTAVFYFDTLPISTLLNRLFKEHEAAESIKPDEISRALGEVMRFERDLQHCLSHRRNFSLPKADGIIQKLRTSMQQLIQESSGGRRIDVTLWLWNASEMNLRLGKYVRISKEVNNSAYLDRNGLLLSLAQRIEHILKLYLQKLDQRIRDRRPINLLDMFIAHTSNMWRSMVRHATQDAMQTLSIEPYDFVDARTTSTTWIEDVFQSHVIEQFEAWLAGEINSKPPVFSDEEASVLQYLYRRKGGPPKKAPVTSRRMKELIPQLQTKVRLWLGDIREVHTLSIHAKSSDAHRRGNVRTDDMLRDDL
jgi:hypothetical protein